MNFTEYIGTPNFIRNQQLAIYFVSNWKLGGSNLDKFFDNGIPGYFFPVTESSRAETLACLVMESLAFTILFGDFIFSPHPLFPVA
jgi:hypothetical protein